MRGFACFALAATRLARDDRPQQALFRLRPSLFGTCVGDSIADRIREALQASPDGLTRKQIRNLFHGHVSSESIDQALATLSSLQLVTSRYASRRGPGPRTILWSAVDCENQQPFEEEPVELEEFLEGFP